MAKCDLCSDESAILYTVKNPKDPEGSELRLCEECLKTIHEAYVQIK